MQHKDVPDTATPSGLSTDDLAQPRDTSTQESAASPPADVPTFPGESTATPSTATPSTPPEGEAVQAGAGAPDEAVETDAVATDSGTQQATDQGGAEDEAPRLLTPEDEEGFRTRWQEVQSKFVDDPREAVHTADALVADVMQKLATTFADHKQELEGQWNRGEQANTEDLRQALRHYRSFFNRLLVT